MKKGLLSLPADSLRPAELQSQDRNFNNVSCLKRAESQTCLFFLFESNLSSFTGRCGSRVGGSGFVGLTWWIGTDLRAESVCQTGELSDVHICTTSSVTCLSPPAPAVVAVLVVPVS